jgi:sugar (pentulose or hexulose) kinase
MRRIAAIWNRPVIQAGQAGASLGAAVAAAVALVPDDEREALGETLRAAILSGKSIFEPDQELVRAYHASGGYLDQLESVFEEIRIN